MNQEMIKKGDEMYLEKTEILKFVFIGLIIGFLYCKLVYPMKEFGRIKYFFSQFYFPHKILFF